MKIAAGGRAPTAGSDTGALLSRGAPVPGSDSLGHTAHFYPEAPGRHAAHSCGDDLHRRAARGPVSEAPLPLSPPHCPAVWARRGCAPCEDARRTQRETKWDSRASVGGRDPAPVTCAPLPRALTLEPTPCKAFPGCVRPFSPSSRPAVLPAGRGLWLLCGQEGDPWQFL